MRPLACITCGPAYEPLDQVRRITNFSTGEIGNILTDAFLQEHFDVLCFRSETATAPPPRGGKVRSFSTNQSLAQSLMSLQRPPDIILHAAALCDFVLENREGSETTKKPSSQTETIHLTLRPAEKILPKLRVWFPHALIIGWKYELDGSREQATARAAAQIVQACTNACVLNGSAYGPGFGLLFPNHSLQHFPDKSALARHLAKLPLLIHR